MKTIMVTGGTGYLGSWVVKDLLERGYHVNMAARDPQKKEKYNFLQDIADKSEGTLEVFKANLLDDGSFDEAAAQSDAIIHMASPFTLRFKDPVKELIEPAVQGTQNVLNAANKSNSVKRVVLTSSVAAVHGDNIDMQEKNIEEFNESHFNTTSSKDHQPYSYSKVAAEKEAWKIAEDQDKWKLVVINPSFVMGPSITSKSDSESIQLMKDMMKGKFFFGAPELYFGFVDVRDVAQAHILALEKEDAEGRHILVERVMSFLDLSKIIKDKFGKKYKLPIGKAPKWLIKILGGMFGVTAKFVQRNVGIPIKVDASKSKKELGLNYRSMEESVIDMVQAIEDEKKK